MLASPVQINAVRRPCVGLLLTGLAALTVGFSTGAVAQQPAPAATPKAAAPAKPAAPKAPKAEGSAPSGAEQGLRQRVDNLEEQLVDMQVLVGTLESLAKSGGASSASATYRGGAATAEPGAGGVDQARVSGLEAQVRALTTQVQQLTDQVRSLGAQPRRADTMAAPVAAAPPAGFGQATISPAKAESIDGLLANTAPAGSPDVSAAALPPIAAAAPAGDGTTPKQLYEQAYGFLLQQDYGAAETAFDDFLKRYPNDALSGNAQFWLGESHFVRGQYKPAASAFLKGYQTYGKSSKAPDSLLKLAMSLGRLGQKDAACASFGELVTRFPAASNDVKSRAITEKQRTGCP
jgi:tol-pal system protein YbgF